MSNSIVSGPTGNESDPTQPDVDNSTEQAKPSGRRRPAIPDAETCLGSLARLAGLVAMGLLSPAQANSIRASYREILQFHRQHETRAERKGSTDAEILELMRKDPDIFNLLEPLLTDDQIAALMKAAKDGDGG